MASWTGGSAAMIAAGYAALSLALYAAPAWGTTLLDAVRKAYDSNPTLGEQRMRQRIYDEDFAQARAGLQPTASFSGERDHNVQHPAVEDETNESTSSTLTIQQPLFTSGQTAAAINAAKSEVLAGRENLSAVEGQVILNVISAYVGVLRDENKLKVAEDNLAALTAEVREIRSRQSVHQVTLTDVEQSEGRMQGAEALVDSARAQLAITKSQYLQLVGEPPDDLAPVPDLKGMPETIEAAFDLAEANNPTLSQAKFTEQSSRSKVEQAKAAKRPTLSASVQLGYTESSDFVPSTDGVPATPPALLPHNYEKTVTGSLVLRVPIFQSNLDSQVRQEIAQNGVDRLSIEETRRAVIQSVIQAWSQLFAARTTLTAYDRQVFAFAKTYEGMRKEEPFGLRDHTEVLNAEQDFAAAQQALLDARYNEYVARATLMNTLGMLNAANIDPSIPSYRPEAYLREVANKGLVPWTPLLESIDGLGAARTGAPVSADLKGAGAPRGAFAPPMPAVPQADINAPLPSITEAAHSRPAADPAPLEGAPPKLRRRPGAPSN